MKFSNIEFNTKTVLKIAGFAIIVLIVLSIFVRLFSSSTGTLFRSSTNSFLKNSGGVATQESAYYADDGYISDLSIRNILPPGIPSPTPGTDAEEFEVRDYNATIETRSLDETCDQISSLKSDEDIIFENANESKTSCNYTFKAANTKVENVLTILDSLDPKDLSESVYTIKRQIDDFTSEEEILTKKLETIDSTLDTATRAYDEITQLATDTQNVDALAKIIDSKIRIIEQLTEEKIEVSSQLDRLSRAKAEQLDRLEYTYFSVYIYENKFIDGENLADSWKREVKQFFADINAIAQDLTINLLALLFFIIQYIIYAFIVLVVAKYGWKYAKKIWMK